VKGSKQAAESLQKKLLVYLKSRSPDNTHDPTYWKRYKLRWHLQANIEEFNNDHRFGVELRIKGGW
jgi:hypothetical protein